MKKSILISIIVLAVIGSALFIVRELGQKHYLKGRELEIASSYRFYNEAIQEYERASKLFNSDASFRLSEIIYNTELSFEFLKKSYRYGRKDSALPLAECYKNGSGTTPDTLRAISLYKVAAKRGSSEAERQLGELYILRGEIKGLKWLDKALDDGNADAAKIMGDYYYSGNEKCGINSNKNKALYYYEKAFALDNKDGALSANLGLMYYTGEGTTIDYSRAFTYFKHSAELKDTVGLYSIAVCYNNGDGVEKNSKLALKYMKIAADLGHKEAKKYVAEVRRKQRARPNNSWSTCWMCSGTGYTIEQGFYVNGQPFKRHRTCLECGGRGVLNSNSSSAKWYNSTMGRAFEGSITSK